MSDTATPALPTPASVPADGVAVPVVTAREKAAGDRPAADPTRYGDWEKNGRCIDF
ncbi:MAG: DUF1674 domain-containing protein [Pseudomonadota bacterium]|nr:DUF1674 domain-containing protein [Xanthomonadaceae bacterium]MDE2248594.1 DUF1674 domain-containing protein [Xanthomonadaceae bacterium]MDE3209526.1 DUF1674 domain-containing protein [Pseudomonadota bacterium]